jgi:hypothetical protein
MTAECRFSDSIQSLESPKRDRQVALQKKADGPGRAIEIVAVKNSQPALPDVGKNIRLTLSHRAIRWNTDEGRELHGGGLARIF